MQTITQNLSIVRPGHWKDSIHYSLWMVRIATRLINSVAGRYRCNIKIKRYLYQSDTSRKGFEVTIDPNRISLNYAFAQRWLLNKNRWWKIGESTSSPRFTREDPTLKLNSQKELKLIDLIRTGEMHELCVNGAWRTTINSMWILFQSRISYRMKRSANLAACHYRHKKQSGGAGQFAEVYLKIEPYYEGMPEPTEYLCAVRK